MRAFYVFWFFFCSGWGYLFASYLESESPSWSQVVALFPLALLFGVLMFWLELRRLPSERRAHAPSLRLKPWNRPTGMLLFIGLSFTFASVWGVGFAVVGGMPGVRVALNFFALGVGIVAATFVCHRVFPSKFGT